MAVSRRASDICCLSLLCSSDQLISKAETHFHIGKMLLLSLPLLPLLCLLFLAAVPDSASIVATCAVGAAAAGALATSAAGANDNDNNNENDNTFQLMMMVLVVVVLLVPA